ncbi:hypothetical protein tb265_39600 [Gemmatimonadetes bacterium T265]|nr:hypothetical protein tb265_39600 [Gemmatimonadetes bacterium T265]
MTTAAPVRGRGPAAPAPTADVARSVARSKVMAIRFVAHLSALSPARRAELAARLRDAERADAAAARDAARADVRAAAVDPTVVGRDVDVRPFLAALAQLTRDAVGDAADGDSVGGDTLLARWADDVVRALLVHTHPAYRADFQYLYAPFAPDIGFDRLLLG